MKKKRKAFPISMPSFPWMADVYAPKHRTQKQRFARWKDKMENLKLGERAHREAWEEEKKIKKDNAALLLLLGVPPEAFADLIDGCTVSGHIEVVTAPAGKDQLYTDGDFFKGLYVMQWQSGEDWFHGFIYGLLPSGQWLKIPFDC